MFFGFQLTLGLMMVFYGYSVMKNPRVWGDQGRRAVKAEHFEEYCRQNGLFFLKAGCVVAVIGALDALITLDALLYALLYLFGLAFAFYPLVKWCRENEGFSWPWPHVQSEKKRIKELRREQESQEKAEQDSDKQYPLFVEDVILYPSFLSEFIAFHTAFLDTPSFSARYCPEISSPLCASSSERMSFFTDIVFSFQEIICIYGIV